MRNQNQSFKPELELNEANSNPENWIYVPGYPLPCKFSGKDGKAYRVDTDEVIAGGVFKIAPLAWRMMKGEIFGRNDEWVELFFLNTKNQVCTIQFHGNSVRRFKKAATFQVLYENSAVEKTVIECTPEKIQHAHPGNPDEQVSYYVMNFNFTPGNPFYELAGEFGKPFINWETWRDDVQTTGGNIVEPPEDVKHIGF